MRAVVENTVVNSDLPLFQRAVSRPPREDKGTGLAAPASKFDPLSSRIAADDVEKSGKRREQIEQTVSAVSRYPGLTSMELSHATGIDRYVLARRLPEAETLGLVTRNLTDGGTPRLRHCKVTGRLAMTWTPAREDADAK